MKLALHRSVTFWSGLLVMGFICWAWWTSASKTYSGGYGDCLLLNTESRVALGHVRLGKRGWFNSPLPFDPDELGNSDRMQLAAPRCLRHLGGEFWSDDNFIRIGGATDELDPDAFWLFPGKKDDWLLFIPHWIILLTVALPWLALLFWRARRRAAAAILSAAGESPA